MLRSGTFWCVCLASIGLGPLGPILVLTVGIVVDVFSAIGKALTAPRVEKPKTRAQRVRDAETLLDEELRFSKKLTDPVARAAAEASANVRFRDRLRSIMEAQ
jgi:hypothetical protein